jgi:hypothetical protein
MIDTPFLFLFGPVEREEIESTIFICGHNGTGVVRDIDVESSVHVLIGGRYRGGQIKTT